MAEMFEFYVLYLIIIDSMEGGSDGIVMNIPTNSMQVSDIFPHE